jgi:WD40 repeat protein
VKNGICWLINATESVSKLSEIINTVALTLFLDLPMTTSTNQGENSSNTTPKESETFVKETDWIISNQKRTRELFKDNVGPIYQFDNKFKIQDEYKDVLVLPKELQDIQKKPRLLDTSSAALVLHREEKKNETGLIQIKEQRKQVKPLWHPPWKLKTVISGHVGWVRSVAVDPSNEWFASGAGDRIIKIWDLASGSLKLSHIFFHVVTINKSNAGI